MHVASSSRVQIQESVGTLQSLPAVQSPGDVVVGVAILVVNDVVPEKHSRCDIRVDRRWRPTTTNNLTLSLAFAPVGRKVGKAEMVVPSGLVSKVCLAMA